MAFTANSIKLGAAQTVFDGAKIEAIEVGGKVVYYRASFDQLSIEHKNLTDACRLLWVQVAGGRNERVS